MKLKFIIVLLLMSFSYSSCKNISDIDSTLNDVSEYMEEYPDSALSVLQKIEPNQLADKKQKAKYALLLTIALDKSYIDTTNFNVIQPAIDYYLKHGSPTEKLRTYYYMGRIYYNAGNDEEAMNSFVSGLAVGGQSSDNLTKARMLFAKARIHYNLYEFKSYSIEMLKASKLFYNCKKQTSYFNALTEAFEGFQLLDDVRGAKAILTEINQNIDSSKIGQIAEMYEMKMAYYKISNNLDSLNITLESYIKNINSRNIKWLSVSNNYFDLGQYDKALQAINMYCTHSNEKTVRYYSILSRIFDKVGNYQEALENYKMYIKLSDSADMAIFRANTKFVEEKYALQLQNEKERNAKRIVAICAVLVILLLAAVIRWLESTMKRNREKYHRQCELLEYEKENLLDILERNRQPDSRIRNAIEGRLDIINQFFKAHVTENYDIDKKALKDMEALFNDKVEFLRNTTLIVEGNNPHFISHLKQCGLTEQEIHFTCLYIIGLRGVHIGKYLETTNIYNISSGIRKKLGIDEYKTNLDKLITELYENCMG